VPITLYESDGGKRDKQPDAGTSVVTGQVINNCDQIAQGKVLIRIPSLDQEVWARLSAVGGGSGAGFLYTPRVDDAVLVALNQDDPTDAFILGGLWSSNDSPPVASPEAISKRVIKSGLKGGAAGHEIELDDTRQSISILSSTKQKVLIEPTRIEISNDAGTLKITLDNKQSKLIVEGVNLELKGTASLKLDAPKIDMTSNGPITISSSTVCTVKGTASVQIN
jgi:uncharacterized protein involved in type VI secretion and phage assembly